MKIGTKLIKIKANFFEYLLLILSLGAIFSAGVYYLYALNWWSIIIIIILVFVSFRSLYKYLFKDLDLSENIPNIKENEKDENHLNYKKYLRYWPFLVYFLLYAISFYILYKSRSSRALITPWQVVNSNFFIFYILSSLILIFILLKNKVSATTKLISLSAHYFLGFAIAAVVYKVGYGFDPFIHQATMELIDKKGLVTPKPFYYLGEYGLIVILHKLTGLSIYLLNKFFVPILAAIFLPFAAYRLTTEKSSTTARWLTPLFILTLTFAPFIVTTPQNLSYLFLILTIVFGLTKNSLLWPLILALATLAIHPLTGIPALSWWLVIVLNKYSDKLKPGAYRIWKYLLFSASALVLPLALFFSGGSDLKKINWNFYFIIDPLKNLFINLSGAGQENWLLNLVYFFSYNYNLWLILIIGVSLIFFYRHLRKANLKNLLFINLALAVSYLISSQIIFTDLINYEQTNFASRLLVLISIFFLPFIILGLQNLINLILNTEKPTKIIWLIFGLSLITISLYISYPRFDKYFNSRGYSTSANDLTAVNLIAQIATKPYLVLANQQASVAALKELGFDHYYKTPLGLVYFYPIPTGGPLYQYYLDMVYKSPSRETMAEARELVGVEESYLIINKYWHQSGRIINEAKIQADKWQSVNDEVYIFKYLPESK